MYKGVTERYGDEVLSDNTAFQRCKQCKDCKNWDENSRSYFENAFDKTSCRAYPYPDFKPIDIINNRAICEFKEKRNG